MDTQRARKRRPVQPYPELEDESWQPTAGDEADPERTAVHAERSRAIAAALTHITDDQRTAIVLYDVEGYDYGEIAEMTGVSLGTVKSRIHRGRLSLCATSSQIGWSCSVADRGSHAAARSGSRSPTRSAAGMIADRRSRAVRALRRGCTPTSSRSAPRCRMLDVPGVRATSCSASDDADRLRPPGWRRLLVADRVVARRRTRPLALA